MERNDELDVGAIVKTAEQLPEDARKRFLELLPVSLRTSVIERLGVPTRADALVDEDNQSKVASSSPATVSDTNATLQRDSHESLRASDLDIQEMPTQVVPPGHVPPRGTVEVGESSSAHGSHDFHDQPNRSSTQNHAKKDSPNDSSSDSPQSTVQLVRRHARGAIGEVYVAYDEQLSREVALKRIRRELPPSVRRVKRFLREAVITAKLQHPGIVPIYNLGNDGVSAHYTMPLVSGSTLSRLINHTHQELGPRPTRALWMSKIRPLLTHFIAVCNAIDYAHSQNVLHRDLKPSNIIVGSQGQTLVLDWGCAKDIGEIESDDGPDSEDDPKGTSASADITVAGSVMGTIEFMSPEQASGDNERVGTASDIYGLGATLLNLLTGDVAFAKDSDFRKTLDLVKQGKFRRVDELSSRVPKPLVAICHRAMSLQPKDRYASAGDLGRDIDAFLAGEKVSAYKDSLMDRSIRFVNRHQTAVATLLGTFLVGFASLLLVAFMINRQRGALAVKNRQLDFVNDQLETSAAVERALKLEGEYREQQINRQLYNTEMLLASEASSEPGGIGRMRELIDHWRLDTSDDLRGWEWNYLDSMGRREQWKLDLNATVRRILFTRNHPSARIFDAGQSQIITVDMEGQSVVGLERLASDVTMIDYNDDQSLLAMGYRDGRVVVVNTNDSKEKPVEFGGLESAVTDLRWNVGGDYLAACDTDGELIVWQWYKRDQEGWGSGVLNQPGKRLLTWSYDGKVLSWTTGNEIRSLTIDSSEEKTVVKDDWIVDPSWSHEGKYLAYIGPENSVVVTDVASNATHRFFGHQLFIESLRWHPTRNYLLSASADGSVRIWNPDTQKQVKRLLGHSGSVYSAAWNRDGRSVVSGGLPEDSLRVWDVSSLGNEAFDRELQDHPATAWHPDDDQLAVAEHSDIVLQSRLGEIRRIRNADENAQPIFGLSIHPNGSQIACVSGKGRIWTTDVETGDIIKVYDNGSQSNQFPEITEKGVVWSPDGTYLAGVGAGGKLRVWELSSGDDVSKDIDANGKILVVAWSPKSESSQSLLAYAGTDNRVFVFDPQNRDHRTKLSQPGWKTSLAWSGDGAMIAVDDRRSINVWDLASETLVAKCDGPSAMILAISWNSAHDRIAALSEDGQVSLWNANTWKYCAKFDLHNRAPYSINWSPDGDRLVSTARHGRIVFQEVTSPSTAGKPSAGSPTAGNTTGASLSAKVQPIVQRADVAASN
ncbi:serine/threonine-protein kinase [Rubripirellula amarantea]|nr:serine/threonine-protein kinase [Rubripirellula amarantea]